MKKKYIYPLLCLFLGIILFGCKDLGNDEGFLGNKITLSTYAKDIGFTLTEPSKSSLDVKSSFSISGEVKNLSDMDFPHLWIVIEHENQTNEPFNYYMTLEEQHFRESLILPFGAGEYQISIRAPYDGQTYYDVASFTVNNLDDDKAQIPEYTRFGIENELYIRSFEQSEGIIHLSGRVGKMYDHDKILIEVSKGDATKQLVTKVKDYSFTSEIPLYFGEGSHKIQIQLHNPDDDYYYTSGILTVDNETKQQFATFETYSDYFTSGIQLEQPTNSISKQLKKQTYKIKGRIEEGLKDPIKHIIVTMTYLEEGLESGYIIPVEDNIFEEDVYFRFGPGTYDVKINIPDNEKTDQSMFYYRTVAKITHEINDIPDERDLLPSRGIESEHPTIVKTAKEVTAGLLTEREKAKAIYEFVAKNISYDVQKAEADLFSVDDSALTTLQSKSGICQDYAFLATALLRAIGIEAHYVSGHAGERHAWVEAKVDGQWIEMDPTWGAGYVYEGEFYFQYNEEYFDPDPEIFQQTHTREQIMY